MVEYISFIDVIIAPFYLVLFFFIGLVIKNRNIEERPYYRFFIPGLMLKMLGSIAICLIYVYYYGSGDTTNYYYDGVAISKLFLKNPWQAIRFTFLPLDNESWYAFDYDTGWPIYSYDPNAIVVDKLTWVLSLISLNSFIGQTMLLSFICYFAIWRLYQMFVFEFPKLELEFAISVLFMPSVVFWASGLLKDSITFAAVAVYTASFHHLLKIKTKQLKNLLYMILSSYLMLAIKPYIFFAVIPGTVLWFAGLRLSEMKNFLVRMSIAPALVIIAIFFGYLMLRMMSGWLGEYSIHNVMEKAIVTQQDLMQEYYLGSSFDIGEYDATIQGIMGKAPAAINAALFRPYLWEAYNPAMYMSAIENMILLIITIYLIIRMRVYNLFRLLFRHHVLFFSVFFSLFFSFSVGLSTSNFGSLVRYKIPAIPFYVASLFIIYHTFKELKASDEAVTHREVKSSA
ncbi:MAG: hypothetical protein DWQ44_07990 [Bacteroidetes bacterium]|nr:MAG: hypothetical protein DWQ33_06805 [Bacteroidota bacterium]REK33936.1 MAG: hypothetical protein DWQ44_07990 [Bacteroidota bacterium]REK47702.1 MAG: hypothetical protein DWQ48_12025 [Bacteroidota bacterium]